MKSRRTNQRERIKALFADYSTLVSNAQLAEVSLKYSARVSELRSEGFQIKVHSEDPQSGLVWYCLDSEPAIEYSVPVIVHVTGVSRPVATTVRIAGARSESHARSMARAAAARIEIVGNAMKTPEQITLANARDIQDPVAPSPQMDLFSQQPAA